ncbi:ANTAR domain-containing protein [Streptomyces lydicus]|uniref:ANTAR domain-containing protein n=1 Tax=Streptomyces lydicus TaxID=47763 RepID=UPI003F4DCE1D
MLGRISPDGGFTVLREVSQHTNIKVSAIAEQVLRHAQGTALPGPLLREAASGSCRAAHAPSETGPSGRTTGAGAREGRRRGRRPRRYGR